MDFRFPTTFYIGCISVSDPANKKHHLCLTRVFTSLEILRRYVLFVIDELKDSENNIAPLYEGSYIKCKFSRLYPLHKYHWRKRHLPEMDIFQKFRNDINIIKYWKMAEVLVTPDGEISDVEFYSFCFSLFKNTPDKDIDLLIKNSNQVVDKRARNAAFYEISKPVKTNWLAGGKKDLGLSVVEEFIN